MPITPEDRARARIDQLLTAAGWIVQSKRKEGDTLTGVELQTTKYSEGIPANLSAPRRPLPFQQLMPGRWIIWPVRASA
jgi:hypothetical protein